MLTRKTLRNLCLAAFATSLSFGLTAGLAAPARADTPLKVVLNWKFEGPQGMFFLAQDRGYFKAEGIDPTFDQGNGSGAAVPLVANGSYDIGFGDINALIQLAAKSPADAPVGVFMLYNRPPFTVAVKKDSPIKTPADFPGHLLGGAANDGALKLFPALCGVAKVDCSTVQITNMAPNLREQMLMQGQVEGVFGYVNTIRFAARGMGVDADSQLRFIRYGDYGMDLYSNCIIVSHKLLAEHPEVVKGFVRALVHGIKDAMADPKAAVEAVSKREPLIKADVELAKFLATMRDEMSHPEIAKIGLGDIDDARMKTAIDILVKAQSLPSTPTPAQVFDRSFMPPKADRPSSIPSGAM